MNCRGSCPLRKSVVPRVFSPWSVLEKQLLFATTISACRSWRGRHGAHSLVFIFHPPLEIPLLERYDVVLFSISCTRRMLCVLSWDFPLTMRVFFNLHVHSLPLFALLPPRLLWFLPLPVLADEQVFLDFLFDLSRMFFLFCALRMCN